MDTYVYLFSTDSLEHFKENTLTRFSNNFPLSIKYQRVRIALQSLSVQALLPKKRDQPKIIHVCVKNTGSDFYSGECHSVIHSIPINQEKIRLVHVVDRKTFFKLTTTDVKNISVELLNENFEPLEVATGESTVVQLKISSLYNDMKIIRLASDDSKELFPTNLNNDFRVRLNKNIRTPSERYEIALDSLTYFNDVSYEPPPKCRVIIEKPGQNDEKYDDRLVGTIMDYVYLSAEDFNSEENMMKALGRMNKSKVAFKINHRRKFTIINGNDFKVKVRLPNCLVYVMGGKDLKEVEIGEEVWFAPAKQETELDYDEPDFSLIYPQTMLMMCDIIKPVMTGSIQQKVLKAIPLQSGCRKKYVHYTAKHLDFFTIDPPKIEEMHIQFQLVSNKKIKFATNRALYCTFQIRKKFKRR